MGKKPYIPIYTGDYLKDTRSLSLEAKGALKEIFKQALASDEKEKQRYRRRLHMIPDMTTQRIYISGAISGLDLEKVRLKFKEAEVTLN